MKQGLIHLHSATRYVIVALLIITIIRAFMSWFGKKPYTAADKKFALFTLVFTHIQLVMGLVLYILSKFYKFGKFTRIMEEFGANELAIDRMRFYGMEHIAMMLVAIILITIGYSSAKRTADGVKKHKLIALFYGIGFAVMFFAIPWPFLQQWATWF